MKSARQGRKRSVWHRANVLQQDQTPFGSVPVIFKSRPRTQLILALAINGPSRRRDTFLALSNVCYSEVTRQLSHLEQMAIVRTCGKSHRQVYWLNTAHPAYKHFCAIAKLVDKRWPVPRWKKRRCPNVLPDTMPEPPPKCRLFFNEMITQAILYIAARRKADAGEIAEILFGTNSHTIRCGLRFLEKTGLVKCSERAYQNSPKGYHLNPDHFAAKPLSGLLAALLNIYPEIRARAKFASKYRTNRKYKENWRRPHIRGPRKGSQVGTEFKPPETIHSHH